MILSLIKKTIRPVLMSKKDHLFKILKALLVNYLLFHVAYKLLQDKSILIKKL